MKSGFSILVPPLMFIPFLFSPTCPPSNFQTLPSLPPAPSFVMPKNPSGPWVLDTVKKRLRREQEERERIASARYRQLEERQLLQRTDSQGQTSACQCSLLLILTLCCCLMALVVIVLSSKCCLTTLEVRHRKDNEKSHATL